MTGTTNGVIFRYFEDGVAAYVPVSRFAPTLLGQQNQLGIFHTERATRLRIKLGLT